MIHPLIYDAKELSNVLAQGFLSVDFKLKSFRERVLRQSCQNHTEQPKINVGAGWLFIATAFPRGR